MPQPAAKMQRRPHSGRYAGIWQDMSGDLCRGDARLADLTPQEIIDRCLRAIPFNNTNTDAMDYDLRYVVWADAAMIDVVEPSAVRELIGTAPVTDEQKVAAWDKDRRGAFDEFLVDYNAEYGTFDGGLEDWERSKRFRGLLAEHPTDAVALLADWDRGCEPDGPGPDPDLVTVDRVSLDALLAAADTLVHSRAGYRHRVFTADSVPADDLLAVTDSITTWHRRHDIDGDRWTRWPRDPALPAESWPDLFAKSPLLVEAARPFDPDRRHGLRLAPPARH